MPIGIVSNDEFESELNSSLAIHKDIKRGRGPALEVPEEIRTIISEEAIISEAPVKEIASAFGVSPSSVSAYKNSATSTSTYNEPNKNLKKNNERVREIISNKARKRLMMALNHITDSALQNAKLRDISAVAKDMSTIMANQAGNNQSGNQLNAQFIFHVPQARNENEYEVVDVVT